ncbi:regulatory LuxR family protein [Streptomyces sp. 846.5]|nr:LuxR family transcriptional regulator [Streptomyces sp. 846.5]TDU04517.1 regulatory LuxR family protein [Streptomyces sp. 846.5]
MQPAPSGSTPPIGRGLLLTEARGALRPDRGLLLTGPAGIGKSAVLDVLAAEAAAAGTLVLRSAPIPEESVLPYAALSDLLSCVPADLLAQYPPLLLRTQPATAQERLALHTAAVRLLRTLAGDASVLLVLDGLQDLDLPSAALLSFLTRRAGTLAVTVAAAERTGSGESALRNRLCPPTVVELAVPPLPDDAIEELIARQGTLPPVRELRRIQQLSAGNPFYARELALAAGNRPQPGGRWAEEEPPVPRRLRNLLLAPTRALPPQSRSALLLVACSPQPTLGLLHAAGVADPVAALAEAERLGLVSLSAHGRVRLRHPLLGAALQAEALLRERIAVHTALAEATAEPVARARHLALAHPREDAQVAAALAAAADVARHRGEPDTAYELTALAAEHTPAADPRRRTARLLAAAAHAADAGLHEDARRSAAEVLTDSADPAQRVRARMILLETVGQALDEAGGLIQGGLADAGDDPSLLAPLYFWSAVRELLGGRTGTAAAEAQRAATLAFAAEDRATRVEALGLVATVQGLRGNPVAADAALELALKLAAAEQSASLLRRLALAQLDADQVPQARRRVTALLDPGAGAEGVEDTLATLVALVRIQTRAGECRQALATAERCTALVADAGQPSPLAAYAAALAETAGGSTTRAAELAQRAVDGCAAASDRLYQVRALGALGSALLLPGGAEGSARAGEALQRARELSEAMELADPDTVRRLADLVEALLQSGETAEAHAVLAEARRLTDAWPAPWGAGAVAALDRAEGLALAALGRTEQAIAALRVSASRLQDLPLPLELARTLIAWGAVERRARHRAAARAVLDQAGAICRTLRAEPLLLRIQQERERLEPGDRACAVDDLTASEHRVAELVAGGATNREVAAALFVSIKTVEGTLSRVYRKLGVRSRTALARAVVAVSPTGPPQAEPFTQRARVVPLM